MSEVHDNCQRLAAATQRTETLATSAHQLDYIDIRILGALQRDGRLANNAVAKAVGLSAPPCLRRIRVLEENGFIQKYEAKLNHQKLGFEVTAFVFVGLTSQAAQSLELFEAKVHTWPTVRECHSLTGGMDYLLKCVSRDLDALQAFVTSTLMKLELISTIKTSIVLNSVKDEPAIPPPLFDSRLLAIAEKNLGRRFRRKSVDKDARQ